MCIMNHCFTPFGCFSWMSLHFLVTLMFSGAVFVTMAYSFSFSQDGMRGFKVHFYPTYLNEAQIS